MKIEVEVTVKNKMGIHARPAAEIAKLATKYESEVILEKDGDRVDAKSIMSVMMLAAASNTTIRIIADGEDAEEVANALKEMFDNGFGEEYA